MAAISDEVRKSLLRIAELLDKDPVLTGMQCKHVLGGLGLYVAITCRAMGLTRDQQIALAKAAYDDTGARIVKARADAEKLAEKLVALLMTPRPKGAHKTGEVSGTEYARQVDPNEVAKVDAEADRIIAAALDTKPEPDKEN